MKVKVFSAEVVAAGIEEMVAQMVARQGAIRRAGITERVDALIVALSDAAMSASNDSLYSGIGLTRDMVSAAIRGFHAGGEKIEWADTLARNAALNAMYSTKWSQKQVWFMEAVLWIQGQRREIPKPSQTPS